jgi:murein DD-endopeptidase MepM/ murein hydrolase activator NlpD
MVHTSGISYTWPIYGGWITKEFIDDPKVSEKKHLGIDIAAKIGTPVKATANGVVSFAGWTSDFGNIIIIDHGNGFLTKYGHNSRVLVERGDIVKQGKIIAFVGDSGRSSAPHLHFEIWKDGTPVNPRDYLLR